jgi:aminodeoxyfutalosine synthase
MHIRDRNLIPVWEKVQRGERLTLEDGLTMYASGDLIGLGAMAGAVQKERSGDAVYFVLNQKIEPTNVCVLSCTFCDFAAKSGDPRAYEMSVEEILAKLSPDIREVHITGGMPPDWPWERYLGIVRAVHERLPEADIKAFTAVEIDFFHKKFRMPVEEVLRRLIDAGLRTMREGAPRSSPSASGGSSSIRRSARRRGSTSTGRRTGSEYRRIARFSTATSRRWRNG